VVPCCLDGEGNMSLGNIYEESLDEILNGDRASKFYNGFSNRKKVEELCKRCGYSEMFSK
jgi:radical SAM protein with 4Fe4S-binding SPASM domain